MPTIKRLAVVFFTPSSIGNLRRAKVAALNYSLNSSLEAALSQGEPVDKLQMTKEVARFLKEANKALDLRLAAKHLFIQKGFGKQLVALTDLKPIYNGEIKEVFISHFSRAQLRPDEGNNFVQSSQSPSVNEAGHYGNKRSNPPVTLESQSARFHNLSFDGQAQS
jgi:hypothetical protein